MTQKFKEVINFYLPWSGHGEHRRKIIMKGEEIHTHDKKYKGGEKETETERKS
jgi:hypothetical protein